MAGLTVSEKRAVSVLAFLMFRMRRNQSAERYYRALARLCEPGSREYRQAKAGLAAVAIDEGRAGEARELLREAEGAGPLSSRDAALILMRAQALWLQNRPEESAAALAEYRLFRGTQRQE